MVNSGTSGAASSATSARSWCSSSRAPWKCKCQPRALVLEHQAGVPRDHVAQAGAHLGQLLGGDRGDVQLAARVAALAAVQPGRREIRAEQAVEIRDGTAAHQCQRVTGGTAQPRQELEQGRLHDHGVRRGCELQQRAVHVQEQAPGSRRQRYRVYRLGFGSPRVASSAEV
jgi:hypothetical protein